MKRLKENHYKMVWDPFRYHINGDKKKQPISIQNIIIAVLNFFFKFYNITITIIVF